MAQNKFCDTAKGGVIWKTRRTRGRDVDPEVCSGKLYRGQKINPLAKNGGRILMIVSKKLSNEIGAVGMQPARTSWNWHSANAPTCTVFVRYEQ